MFLRRLLHLDGVGPFIVRGAGWYRPGDLSLLLLDFFCLFLGLVVCAIFFFPGARMVTVAG